MEIKASVRYLGVAPRKVRLAAAVVKGMDLARAEHELANRRKRAAPVLLKLLRSAAANARHNFSLEGKDLKVKDLRVDAGPVSKRYRARAFGRAASIRRRTSHIWLTLETTQGMAAAPAKARREAPAVREATAEDLQGTAANERGADTVKGKKTGKKSSGFMPRVFQRKAI